MSDAIIKVSNLSKCYLLGHEGPRERYTALRDVVARSAKNILRTTRDLVSGRQIVEGDEVEEFWALKDVSFEVKSGEVLGIIGRNGAGKSTLLKLLSRITEPTSGRIEISGRVASLLEVGTGFHPELSGRENIFLNGAILGMTRAEIKRKFDEIVAFAEVERFLDTPVKRYSSGMYVRLAFAVAAHLEPEILVVDEVLAVGDMEFQQKCMGKMESISHGGRTVLFVSHNMGAISTLCKKCIYLKEGKLSGYGETEEVMKLYMAKGDDLSQWHGDAGSEELRLIRTWVRSLDPSGRVHTASPIEIGVEVEIIKPINSLILGFNLNSEYGYPLAYCLYDDQRADIPERVEIGTMIKRFVIPSNTLASGTYHINFDIGIHMVKTIIKQQGELTFSVENVSGLGRRFIAPLHRGYYSLLRPPWAV